MYEKTRRRRCLPNKGTLSTVLCFHQRSISNHSGKWRERCDQVGQSRLCQLGRLGHMLVFSVSIHHVLGGDGKAKEVVPFGDVFVRGVLVIC